MRRIIALVTIALLLAACGKEKPASDLPLAFVPADTPYVYANLEPVPAAVTEQWTRPLQDYWPTLFTMYQSMLQEPKLGLDQRTRDIATAIMEELKTHANWTKLREIGLKPDGYVAFYGVGLVPVMRLELGDPAAFRAEVARVEQKAGAKMAVAKVGDQEYWQIGGASIAAAIAIEGSHLVVTMVPPGGSDALKRTLLGLTRPAQTIADSGALAALAKQHGYAPQGEGFVDFARLTERLTKLTASDAEFAKATGAPAPAVDDTCRHEYAEIAKKFPRLVIGAEELSAQRMRIAAQLEIEPGLAAQIAAAIGAAPGTGVPADGAIDVSIAAPVLKMKDFWLAQADAVAAKPHACANLRALDEGFAQARARIDVTIPPPFSDLTGARITLSRFEMNATGAMPDFAGKLLLATTNPMAAMGMAQLALAPLQKIKIQPDGKAVALPADLLPVKTPPMAIAMSDKAIALATGDTEIAALPAFLAAPAAASPMFLRMHFSGVVYGWMARAFEKMKAALPAESQKTFDQQIVLFGMYEKWLRTNEVTLTATPTGIVFRQTIELNQPASVSN